MASSSVLVSPRRPDSVRVIVVGAGMAGLSAAEQLHKHGFTNTLVLEASDRIGGRIHTVPFGQRDTDVVELGAQYIGGLSDQCSSYVLAKQCGIVQNTGPDNILDRPRGVFHRSNGRLIDRALSEKAYRIFDKWYAEKPRGHPNAETFLRKCLIKDISDHFPDEAMEDVRCVFNSFLTYITLDQGAFPAEVRMPPSEGYVHMPGGYLKVPQPGLGTICEKVAENIPKSALMMNCEVQKINWDAADSVIISVKDGHIYRADYVIVTCSLGILKVNDLFLPSLPAEKMTAISRLGFGAIGKIFLYYDQPFWTKEQRRIQLAWTDEEYKGNGYQRSEWWKGIESFDTVITSSNVLVCWVGCTGAEVMETLPEEELIDQCTAVLRNFLGNPNIPHASRCTVSSWNTSPFYRGVYSYIRPGSSPADMAVLARPLYVSDTPRVLFAGEATSVCGQGFMHGARDSGLREADRIIRHICDPLVAQSKL